MEALSQKKKIGIIAGAILLLTVVALVSTGRMSLTGLSSSAISSSTYVCNEQNQARNLAQYNQIPNNIINANNKISIISGEIKVLQDKINAHNTTIAQKQAQITTRPAEIVRLNGLIVPLTTFINTKCSKPTGSMVRTCNDKKKEKLKYENEITKLNNLENDITKLQNEIGTPENSKSLKWKIQLKENQIGIWRGKIAGYELSKKQYERCALELKTKPTVFSAAMSGEIKLISGEIQPGTEKLVSGEIMFFTGTVAAPLVSGEVTISGEVGQPTLLTVVTNKMEFSVKPTPENNFNIKDWFLEFDQYARTACTSKQVSSNPVEIKVTCNLPAKNTPPIIISAGTVGNFKLIGKLGSIAMPLAVETNFVSLQYNWSRTDIDKQTVPSNLRYEKSPVTDVYFRFASWTCYNGEKQNEGGASSCKPQSLWKQYAETFCQNKCSPETGKCGVNSYSNSEQCIDAPSRCGNGIKEGAEQCDDGNTNNGGGCSQECTLEWAYPWYMMKTDRQEYGNGGTILLEISSMTNAKWFVDLYIQPYNWYGSESGVLIQKNIEINPKTTYKIAIPNYPNIFDETDNYLLVISAAGQARKPQNVNSLHIKVSVPTSIICGNGIKEGAEQCDDGNTANGDGCDSLCKSEVVNGCNDSDGGENIFKYGEAVIWEQKVQDQCNLKVFNGYNDQYNLVKSCTGSNCVVLEAICDQYSTNDGLAEYARSKIVSCPNGCNDGACLQATTQKLSGLDVRVNGYINPPQSVKVNTPIDITIRAVDSAGNNVTKYDGTVLFEVIHPAGEPLDKSDIIIPQLADGKYGYQFTSSDQGSHTFTGWFTFKKSGIYSFIFKDPATQTDTNVVYRGFWITVIDTDPPVYTCTDSDGATNYNVKGIVQQKEDGAPVTLEHSEDYCEQRCDPFNLSPMGGNCADTGSVVELSCRPDGSWLIDVTAQPCPNGCSDGACKPAETPTVCEDLSITPSTIQGGGTINYTCQANNDILCNLDPAFCKPKTYSVVIKKPDGGIVQTSTTATGSITIPSSPTGTYTAECFVNGQTTTIATCKKPITNQAPVIACTGTLPTNASILVNVGNTSRAWTYDGSPTGPYQNCSFKCPTGTTFKNNACVNLITAEYVESGPRNRTVYVIPAGGNSLGDDTSHNFYIKSAEDITIRELTIKVDHPESIRYIWVGGPVNKAAVINGKAVISGLNQYARGNSPTNLIQIYVQYNSVGLSWIPSNTSSKITITEVKYDNSKSERIAQSIESSSIPMYIVGSLPSIYPDSDYSFTGLKSGVNKIWEFFISTQFGNSADIKVNEILVKLSAGDFPEGTSIENIQLKKNTGESFSCTKTLWIIKCPFGTASKTDFDGYIISAWAQEIFSIYGTINGPLNSSSFVSTKIDIDNFNWDDGSTNGVSGLNLSGKYLPSTTMWTYTIRK